MSQAHFSCAAPLLALSTACLAVQQGREDAMPAVRRIARRLQEAALHSGWDDAAAAAAALGRARDRQDVMLLAQRLEQQLQVAVAASTEPAASLLIVEDDVVTAAVNADLLRGDGHTVIVTAAAGEARSILRSRTIDLVLLDLVLPNEDGRELLAELRADPAMHMTPILVLSGRPDVNTQAECYALGADSYLVKPVHPQLLRSAVAAALDLAASRRREGRVDRLTALPNRAALIDALERAAALARQSGLPVSVAMIDLDHFKSVNDSYGHAVGDEVLRRSAQAMRASLRLSDLIARWGGEEFAALLPDTSAAGARVALEKALQAVRDLVFTSEDGSRFGVTFSAGIAAVDPLLPGTSALEAADAMLYRAKSNGRNRVVTAESADSYARPIALVADDDPVVARLVQRVLEDQGFEVVACADGRAALQRAQSADLALAVLDVDMPHLNGFETLKALRRIPLLSRMPILMLTGAATEDDVVRGFDLGVSDYMSKPFRTGEFVARVRRLLNRR